SDINFTIDGTTSNFTMITNPYPAPLDWQAIATANTTNILPIYTMWDPNIGIQGAFVTVLFDGTNVSGSTAGRYIQPGEAFFVQATGVGSTVTISESMKAVGNNDNGIYRQTNANGFTSFESFNATLFLTEANGARHSADGVTVRYGNYSAAVDNNDAMEINNWNENIAISRDAQRLAIESRPVILGRDTIQLFMNKMRQTNYEFEFTPSLFTNTGLKAELIDNYLGTRTLLSVVNPVTVAFTVNADAASSATNRFMIVFGPQAALPIDAITIAAAKKNSGVQVDWTAKTETNMDHYEIERSNDGVQFNKIGTIAAVGNSNVAVSYTFFDPNPQFGNNFYRVKAIDRTTAMKYTSIVNVNIAKGTPAIVVYPNPVIGKDLNLQLANLDKGNYTVTLVNNIGQ
ncbi:MAG TPA: hypothetical protein VKH37_05390, partial [Ferruginibacter sp.]|nr:hypothetical protein [Ferruginibacter sp.]